MKITQIDKQDLVRTIGVSAFDKSSAEKLRDFGFNLFRITQCDDGNYGKHHISTRIKPLNNLTIDEFFESVINPNCEFIRIENI